MSNKIKISDIKCITTPKERVAFIDKYSYTNLGVFLCITLRKYFFEKVYNEDYLKSTQTFEISLHITKCVESIYIPQIGSTAPRYETKSLVIMALLLPELLKYKPNILNKTGGWWITKGERIGVLQEIRQEIIEKYSLYESLNKGYWTTYRCN